VTEAITDRAEDVLVRVDGLAGELEAGAEETERLGKLSPPNAAAVRAAGTMRLLQAPEHGGYAADPRIFAEAVMATARRCGSTGWVCVGMCGAPTGIVAVAGPRRSVSIDRYAARSRTMPAIGSREIATASRSAARPSGSTA